MEYYILLLLMATPLIGLAYAYLENYGKFDNWSGRKSALEGLERLRSAGGYPRSWIYNDEKDAEAFMALEKRISKKTKNTQARDILSKGTKPSCITVGGEPILIHGVPPDWDLSNQRAYTPDHLVLYLFEVGRNRGTGKAASVCTLGELEKWLSDEQIARRYYCGSVALGFISFGLIAIRFILKN